MRTKTVKFDDVEIKIASLVLDQVDQYQQPVEDGKPGVYLMRSHDMICWSLNNAQFGLPFDKDGNARHLTEEQKPDEWTPARLTKTYDMPTLEFLRLEILAFSGLKLIPAPAPGGAAAGESSAAAPGPVAVL